MSMTTADEIREATPEQVQRARQYAIRRYEDAGLPHLADEARAGKWDVSTMVYGALRAIIDGDAALAAEKARADAAEAEYEKRAALIRAYIAMNEELIDQLEVARAALLKISNSTGCVDACPCWAKLRRTARSALEQMTQD